MQGERLVGVSSVRLGVESLYLIYPDKYCTYSNFYDHTVVRACTGLICKWVPLPIPGMQECRSRIPEGNNGAGLKQL